MFINCHACRALVATDPVSDLPPAHCPHCGAELQTRKALAATQAKAPSVPATAAMTPETTAGTPQAAATTAPSVASSTRTVDTPAPGAASRPDIAASPGIDIAGMLRGSPPAATLNPHVEAPAPSISANALADAVSPGVLPPRSDAGIVSADASTPPFDAPPPEPGTGAAATAAPPATSSRHARPSPSFAAPHAQATRSRLPRWLASVAILVLSASLLLQVLLADRARFAASATWRPLLTTLCETLGCQLPPWHDPAAFVLLTRDVRTHPGTANVLRVTATFRNDARWAQAWPQLQLRLSDINGREIASRGFTADEYLDDARHPPLIASGQTATIRLDVREPATEAVSFAFDLR